MQIVGRFSPIISIHRIVAGRISTFIHSAFITKVYILSSSHPRNNKLIMLYLQCEYIIISHHQYLHIYLSTLHIVCTIQMVLNAKPDARSATVRIR